MFIQRLCSSIVLLSLFFCAVFITGFIGKLCFTILVVCGAFLSVWEFCRLLEKKGMKSYPVFIGILAVLATLLYVYYPEINKEEENLTEIILVLMIVLFIMLNWIKLLCSQNKLEILQKILNSTAVLMMLVVPFILIGGLYDVRSFLVDDDILANQDYVRKLFFYLIVGTKIGDIGAYAVGSLSNKINKGHNHKLIPSISPGKSWEGLFGGLMISILFSMIVFPWAMEALIPVWISIIFGTVLFFGGAAGDLAESSLKRICEIKDSGKIIPGIGGVLDLVDSLLLNAPIFCFMYWLLMLYYQR